MKKYQNTAWPLAVVAAFLLVSGAVIGHYGITYDSPKNFEEGRINLSYLAGRPLVAADQIKLAMQIHGAFFFMLANASRWLFHDQLRVLDAIAASYAFLPFLTAVFVYIMMQFLTKERNLPFALLWAGTLLTAPRFFGHIFNNPKDVPLLIFYSLALLFFYAALFYEKGKPLNWVLFFVFWSVAVLSKTYAVFIPAILLVWMLVIYQFGDRQLKARVSPPANVIKWTLMGLALALVAVTAFFMPAFFGVQDKEGFLGFKREFVSSLLGRDVQKWTVYPVFQLLVTTPVWVQAFGLVGIVQAIRKFTTDPFASLMLIWFTVTLFIPSTPFVYVYDGIRHFLMVLVPYTFFTASGVQVVSRWFKTPQTKLTAFVVASAVIIGTNLGSVRATHPYQTTYFNAFVGGLRGAQLSGIPYAYDYWLNCYREAVNWLNANAKPQANVLVVNADSRTLLGHYSLRGDLKYDYIRGINFPKNSYLVVPKRESWPNFAENTWVLVRYKLQKLPKVYESYRQGGEIFTIYYQE